MVPRLLLAAAALAAIAARLTHSRILWIEEAYPMAGGVQLLHGLVPHTDFWYDKPPLAPFLYAALGVPLGWPLRLLGAAFALGCAWLAARAAGRLWGKAEAIWAAGLTAFFLTFDLPSATVPLAPDLLLLAPHLAALWLAVSGRPLLSGLAAGFGMQLNPKALFVLGACLLWQWRAAPRVLLGFAAPHVLLLPVWGPYIEQVWRWGILYTSHPLTGSPWAEGLRRTMNWAGFHAVLCAGAAVFAWRGRDRSRFGVWLLLALAGVAGGSRFFPRYYFLLLPVMVLMAARGLCLLGRPARAVLALLLLAVPVARFAPRYLELAAGRESQWSDVAMNLDSQRAARAIQALASPRDTLLVWGYRPDLFVYTRLKAGAPFLDSQPLTGVIADRHLTRTEVAAPELAARGRERLRAARPDWIVDGLGLFNPALAITAYPDLAPWLAAYEEAGRTEFCVIYRRKRESTS